MSAASDVTRICLHVMTTPRSGSDVDVDLWARHIAAGLHPRLAELTATIQRYLEEEIPELGRGGLSIGLLGPRISGNAVAEARYAGLSAPGHNGGEALNASSGDSPISIGRRYKPVAYQIHRVMRH